MKVYLAGYGKGGGELSDVNYYGKINKIHKNRLFSFYGDKRFLGELMKIYLGGNNEPLLPTLEASKYCSHRLFNFYQDMGRAGLEKIMKLYLAGNVNSAENLGEILPCHSKKLNSFFISSEVKALEESVRLYLAGGENKSWLKAMKDSDVKNALYSYYYLNKDHCSNSDKIDEFLQEVSSMKIFLDSGGFSAMTKGVTIDLDKYIEFCNQYKEVLEVYAVLDVIGDFKATMKNQEYMEEKGSNPLPVFHFGGNLDDLKYLCSNYDYIALGGLVPYSKQKAKLIEWLDKCFDVIGTGTKIHGFGMTGLDILYRYPFYSVDSTSWLGGSMRAEIQTFKNGILETQYCNAIEDQGFNTLLFSDIENDKKWLARVSYNALTWNKVEKFMTEIWKRRGVEWS
jgi:hypothetical protein